MEVLSSTIRLISGPVTKDSNRVRFSLKRQRKVNLTTKLKTITHTRHSEVVDPIVVEAATESILSPAASQKSCHIVPGRHTRPLLAPPMTRQRHFIAVRGKVAKNASQIRGIDEYVLLQKLLKFQNGGLIIGI